MAQRWRPFWKQATPAPSLLYGPLLGIAASFPTSHRPSELGRPLGAMLRTERSPPKWPLTLQITSDAFVKQNRARPGLRHEGDESAGENLPQEYVVVFESSSSCRCGAIEVDESTAQAPHLRSSHGTAWCLMRGPPRISRADWARSTGPLAQKPSFGACRRSGEERRSIFR